MVRPQDADRRADQPADRPAAGGNLPRAGRHGLSLNPSPAGPGREGDKVLDRLRRRYWQQRWGLPPRLMHRQHEMQSESSRAQPQNRGRALWTGVQFLTPLPHAASAAVGITNAANRIAVPNKVVRI